LIDFLRFLTGLPNLEVEFEPIAIK